MKYLIPFLCLLFLSSCKGLVIPGQFAAVEELALKRKGKLITIPVGTYTAKIKNHKNKKLKLKLTGINKNKYFNFKIPKKVDLPRENGHFSLTAAEVRQPYDVQGTVSTEKTLSETREDIEVCSYQDRDFFCTRDGFGNRHCHLNNRTRYGRRYVRYKLETSVRNVFVELLTPATNLVQSHFNGEKTFTKRIYSHIQYCR